MTIHPLRQASRTWALAVLPLGLLVLGACNTATPYPLANPIDGARVSANPFPRGTPEFCRQYARQTAANAFEKRISPSEDGFGVRFIEEQNARDEGARAYRRCLDGQTS